MAQSQTQKQWTVTGTKGFESLTYDTDAKVPSLGDDDVLVKCTFHLRSRPLDIVADVPFSLTFLRLVHAASLNYRDLVIPKGQYPFGFRQGVVPGSDGAGIVEVVGKGVTRFKKGDKVVTLFNQTHIAGSMKADTHASGLGAQVDGCLRQYGKFDQQGLVLMPSNLNFLEASTLSCAGLTAWNALYGLEGRSLKPGDWVLTQGTGGVALFAAQFAKAAGARVIATTSSADKEAKLKDLGVDHVINYKQTPNWGSKVKEITAGEGVQHVVEVGGPATIKQSLDAIAIDGVISIIGFLGQSDSEPSYLECLLKLATVRGLFVGSRTMYEQMNRAIEANNIKPIIDPKVFSLDEVKDAYQYMHDQKHVGKLCIQIV
ncbi:NAD(P)-binding protein [Aureobasidium sp. EXF-8845]|nr:NAD(P)-binding protein [Aureobasidium sp. EXF-8845]KAI4858291.1 NAD(P)-binding protein [Aureobasidium sp. EXF-8846]